MSHVFPSGLSHVAAAVADGEPVDWPALESSVSSDEEKLYLARLKTVAEVAQLHATGLFSASGLSSIGHGQLSVSALESRIYPAGSFWGHLKILDLVGKGRYGVVYRAWDPKLEREVALKLSRHHEVAEESEVVHEARVMARVHHQNVVTVYGADSHEGQTGIWMQFIQGRTLEAELAADGPFSKENLTTVGTQLCAALTAVHRAGLVHRDVKPQNVMRDQHGRVVLGDFGTGRLMEDAGWGVAGTPLFLAPELLAQGNATERTDVYALGVTLYHLATGAFPLVGRSIADLRDAHQRGAVPKPLALVRPDLAGAMAELIDRALARSPEHRWPSAEAMRTALDDDASQSPGRSRAHLTMAVIAIALVATLLTSWFVTRNGSEPATASNPPVTTRSMRAMRMYTVAAGMLQGRPPWPNSDAQKFLQEALQFDPEFASARILLAHSLANQRRPHDEVMKEATRALETAATTASEPERAFVEGSFYHFRSEAAVDPVQRQSDLERAAAAYERVLAIEPRHIWASILLTNAYTSLGGRDAEILRVRTAEAVNDPDSAILQTWVAMEYYRIGEFNRAAPFIDRAKDLMSRRPDADNSFHATWLQLAPAHRSWLTDSVEDALPVVDAASPPASDEPSMSVFVRQKTQFYLTLGRLDQAERTVHLTPTTAEQDDLQLAVLTYRNDRAGIRELLSRRYAAASDAVRVIWLPLPFDLFEPQLRTLQRDAPAGLTLGGGQTVDGRLALSEGRVDEAIAHLQLALSQREERGIFRAMWISTLLADAWLAKHEPSRAIDVLESSTRLRSATSFGTGSGGAVWLLTRAKLADVYRQAGRVADAEKVEHHLVKLMAVADEDHPLKRLLAQKHR